MLKRKKNKVAINFSGIFHITFDSSEHMYEKFPSAIFFLADKNGQLITMHEVGGYRSEVLGVIHRLADEFIYDKFPITDGDFLIDAIPITLQYHNGEWEGYFGAILDKKDGSDTAIRALLLGFKKALRMSANYLEYKQIYEKSRKCDTAQQIIARLLKEINYSEDFEIFTQSFIKKLKEVAQIGDFTLLLLNRNGDLFIPRYSTKSEMIFNKDDYIISVKKINEALKLLENEQRRVITKNFTKENNFEIVTNHHEDCTLIPLEADGQVFAILYYTVEEGNANPLIFETAIDLAEEATILFYQRLTCKNKFKEHKRKELLLQVTKKFYSSMDVSAILGEIIYALKEVFPSFDVHLLLSHEWEVAEDLPVKQLSYGKDHSNEVATTAYLTGKLQIEDIIKGRQSVVYAPLRGKQGVYGVLQIMANESFVFPQHETDFIEVLADTGGNAIENAELYQQSRQLVEDLQLINRTSHQLNSNLRLSETISYMTRQIQSSFSAQEIGFFMFRSNGDVEVLDGSTNYFFKETILKEITPFCERIKREKDALFIGDLASQELYLLKPYRSFIAVPMVQSGELIGAVFIVHELAYHFSFNKFKLLQSLIHHSTLAFTNSMLHEELEKLVITDHLTRLYARNYLDEKIQESMKKDAYGCFILMDIDNFKQINDEYGHQVGDDVIVQVANVLKKSIKNSDIAARWGGEELAVYLPKVDLEVAISVAERIREKVAQETTPQVTVSCGISNWKQMNKAKSLKSLFNQADQALYKAKRTGKNLVIIYNENKKTCDK